MKFSTLIRPFVFAVLLTVTGCGGKTTTSETSAPSETAKDVVTTPAPAAPAAASAPSTVPPKPVTKPTTKRAPESRPAAPKPTASQKQPTTSESQAPVTPVIPTAEPATAPEIPPILLEAGTLIEVTLDQSLSSQTNSAGDRFDASTVSPIVVGDTIVIPAGSKVSGTVAQAQSAGKVQGKAMLGLKLDSVTVRGSTYKIQTGSFQQESGSRGKRTGIGAAIGAAAGAAIGAIAGGGKGAAIGAGAGAGAGTVGAVLTGDRDITLPAETKLKFSLSEPVSIRPGS